LNLAQPFNSSVVSTHPADRPSCSSTAANQLRLFLHAVAFWLMWTLRATLPNRSPRRRAQFDTLRLPSACPAAPLMRLLIERLLRMAPI